MGHKTIAEFVENEAVLEKLREIGVNYAQGYGVAMPKPLRDFEGDLASDQAKPACNSAKGTTEE